MFFSSTYLKFVKPLNSRHVTVFYDLDAEYEYAQSMCI